jgi:hypothetical protein
MGAENLAPTGVPTANRATCIESLYRLRDRSAQSDKKTTTKTTTTIIIIIIITEFM